MIRFENVSFSYGEGEERQLRDFDLTIGEGEFILLCGRSACGKTTATKCINGLIPHFVKGRMEGDVYIGGRRTADTPTCDLAEYAGSVFQNPKTQFFNLDSDSELVFGMENLGIPPEEIRRRKEKAVSDLAIEDLLGRSVFRLSGGEKQILALASVYAVDPGIYVLDEPTANMDGEGIERLHGILVKLKAMGKTIVISEHRLSFLTDLVDRAVYIEKGRIERIYGGDEFRAMDEDERIRLGLRSFTSEGGPVPVPSGRREGILRIEDLAVSRGGRKLIEHMDISASEGDIIAVTGENGCGKTSFLRVLCGLAREAGGRIVYDGRKMSCRKRLEVCTMTMQDVVHQLFADSVMEEFPIDDGKCTRQEAEAMLEELDLLETADRHPMTLSGGQKQRLALAAAAAAGKDMMIFDEPTSGLDYGSMCRVSRLIEKISKGRIIFITTHDRELMDMVCTRELRIEKGTAAIYDMKR